MATGIDIYRYQTVNDWRAVKNYGVGFCWVKLTDGNGTAVVKGDAQVRGAKSVGIPVGGYHYAQFGDPVAQAKVFLSEVRRLGTAEVVPMLDLESPFTPNATARDFGVKFCNYVRQQGFRPGVYMSDSFAKAVRPDQWGIPDLVIWIARYGSKPAYGGRYDVHQWTSDGSVPGIAGRVDMNESYTNNHLLTAAEDDTVADITDSEDNRLFIVKNAWYTPISNGDDAEYGGVDDGKQRNGAMILSELLARVQKLETSAAPELDYQKLAAALGADLATTVAKAVNDELARRQAE